MSEKLIEEKVNRSKTKKLLYLQRKEFDVLYLKAQEFIQTSDDHEKIQELLNLLDEDQRSVLLSQYKEKTAKNKKKPTSINFTAESFRKYDNVRIINLVKTLQAHGLPPQ